MSKKTGCDDEHCEPALDGALAHAIIEGHLATFAGCSLPSLPFFTQILHDTIKTAADKLKREFPEAMLQFNLIFSDHKADDREMRVWHEEGMHPLWRAGTKRAPHGVLGAGRSLAEHHICRLISENHGSEVGPPHIFDVGSNCLRLRTAMMTTTDLSLEDVHHNVPNIQPGDTTRQIQARKGYKHCTCLFQDCPHVPGYNIFLFQHSIYYFTLQELITTLPLGSVSYITVHHIFEACGSLQAGQLSYHVRHDGLVVCQAKGNTTPYIHADVAWLKLGYFSNGTTTLTWEKVGSFFDTHVYVMHHIPGARQNQPTPDRFHTQGYGDLPGDFVSRIGPHAQSIHQQRMIGPAILDEETNTTPGAYVPIRKVTLKFGLTLAYTDGGRVLPIPTDLIGTLATKAVMVPRGATLTRTLADIGKRYLLAGNFPAELIPQVLTFAVAAALTSGVEEETATLGRVNAIFHEIFDEHTRVVAGGTIINWRWYHWLNPKLIWNRVTWGVDCCREVAHDSDEALSYNILATRGYAPHVHAPIVLPPETEFPPVYDRKSSETAEMADHASYSYGRHDETKTPRAPVVRPVLPSFCGLIPTTAHNTEDALIHAFRSRVGKKVPKSSPTGWMNIIRRVDLKDSILHPLTCVGRVTPTERDWDGWLAKFPEHARLKFREAKTSLQLSSLNRADLVCSTFLKIEKSGMRDSGGPPALDERMIFSYSPRFQVATGIYNWLLAKRFRKEYPVYHESGGPSRVVWATSENADAGTLGRWFDDVTQLLGGKVWFVVWDQKRFEAHRDLFAKSFENMVCFRAIHDADYRFAESNRRLVGHGQRHNVNFVAKDVLGSGNSRTSLSSFLRSLAGTIHSFGEPVIQDYYVLLNGDDAMLVTRTRPNVDVVLAHFLDLGQEIDLKITEHVHEVEFCQTIPYPTPSGTVWGPKIGRVLARIPWATSSCKDDPVGIALGMLSSTYHIPFLRQYFANVARLAPSVKPVPYEHHIRTRECYDYDETTFGFVFARYGLTRADLVTFNDMLVGVDELRTVLPWPQIEDLAKVDE